MLHNNISRSWLFLEKLFRSKNKQEQKDKNNEQLQHNNNKLQGWLQKNFKTGNIFEAPVCKFYSFIPMPNVTNICCHLIVFWDRWTHRQTDKYKHRKIYMQKKKKKNLKESNIIKHCQNQHYRKKPTLSKMLVSHIKQSALITTCRECHTWRAHSCQFV